MSKYYTNIFVENIGPDEVVQLFKKYYCIKQIKVNEEQRFIGFYFSINEIENEKLFNEDDDLPQEVASASYKTEISLWSSERYEMSVLIPNTVNICRMLSLKLKTNVITFLEEFEIFLCSYKNGKLIFSNFSELPKWSWKHPNL